MRSRPVGLALVGLLVVLLVGCRGDDDAGREPPRPEVVSPPSPPTTVTAAPPVPTRPLAEIDLVLTEVATVEAPTVFLTRAGDDARYIGEKRGRVLRLQPDGSLDPEPVLDVSDEVRDAGEQGFLGAAFSPDGSLLYVHFSDRDGDTRVVEYPFAAGRADRARGRVVFELAQPYSNHNGGELRFGPDGLLYLGLGDGGRAGDPHDHGQDLATLLGAILRIDPRPGAAGAYSVPADNPHVADPAARPEIWVHGLRNPWRFSFDPATGDLWVADVGQDAWEEVSWLPAGTAAGANLGWNRLEGHAPFRGEAPADAVAPVHVAAHADGNCSITGGEVYRGSAIPGLAGTYLFADYCRGVVTGLRLGPDGTVAEVRPFDRARAPSIVSFGRGPDGELYVLSQAGGVHRIDAA